MGIAGSCRGREDRKRRRLVRLLESSLSISRLSLQPWLECKSKANIECVFAFVRMLLCVSENAHGRVCVCVALSTFAFICTAVCVRACQALMSLCSHISIHATSAQAAALINFALPFKKAYHNFPIRFTSAPGGHEKPYLYWSPLPEIVFQREDIISCPSIKGSSALQRVNHIYQSNTGAGGHVGGKG